MVFTNVSDLTIDSPYSDKRNERYNFVFETFIKMEFLKSSYFI